ncbi:hypothetical protein B0H14DRAFT_2613808 [Mycena olivaceomarginata]|nr:hypothetical protein B0H14DRAFT_2613808 [Mycena olivaceomarginata]
MVPGSRSVKIAMRRHHTKFSTAPGPVKIGLAEPQKSLWEGLAPGVVQNATFSTEVPSIEIFFLTKMGPARDGYTRSQALLWQINFLEAVPFCSYVFFPTGPRHIKSPVFITHLVFRLAVQAAMATGDKQCIMAVLGTAPEFQDAPSGFVDQLIKEYGSDQDGQHTHNGPVDCRILGE